MKKVSAYLLGGFMPYSGKLSEEEILLLLAQLEKNLYKDAVPICEYVQITFGVTYSVLV